MPRYVLVEFDSNEAAENFVAKTQARTAQGAHYRILGLFAKPQNFCECGPLTDPQQRKEMRRGSKFGWYIHKPCGRPRRHHFHSPKNLLDPPNTHPRDRIAYLSMDKESEVSGPYPISVKEYG